MARVRTQYYSVIGRDADGKVRVRYESPDTAKVVLDTHLLCEQPVSGEPCGEQFQIPAGTVLAWVDDDDDVVSMAGKNPEDNDELQGDLRATIDVLENGRLIVRFDKMLDKLVLTPMEGIVFAQALVDKAAVANGEEKETPR
jgi:hypothetical protein